MRVWLVNTVVLDRLKEHIPVIINYLLDINITKRHLFVEEITEILVMMRLFIACFLSFVP